MSRAAVKTAKQKSKRGGSARPLARAALVAFAATADVECAKRFYRDQLGLKLVSEDPFALVFDANGTMLRIQRVEKVAVCPYTSLGWDVPDIKAKVKQLATAGIVFERYPGLPQDEHGIWKSPAGAKVAWFKDPEGSICSLTEFARKN